MAVVQRLARQRRFKIALIGLIASALLLGLVVVPFEKDAPQARIHEWFDGVWWSVTTITSVGYGDMYPVTVVGRLIGMVLEVMGVLAFGMLIGMVTVSLYDERDQYYRRRVFDRFDDIDSKLNRLEKKEQFVVEQSLPQEPLP